MDTNDLVSKLTQNLQPVHRIPATQVSSFMWISITLLCLIATILLLGGFRSDAITLIQTPRFLAEHASLILAGVLSTFAAFRLSVPQSYIPLSTKLLIGGATIIWGFHVVQTLSQIEFPLSQSFFSHQYYVHHCVFSLIAMMAVPLVLLFVFIRRGKSTHPLWAGYAAVLATASLAALGMRYFCPMDNALHLLPWHFLPVPIYALTGFIAGKFLLRW